MEDHINMEGCTDSTSQLIISILLDSIQAVGAILNLFCIIIFIKIIKTERSENGHMFKYLFIKSIFDFIYQSSQLPSIYYYNYSHQSYIMQFWYKWMVYYLTIIASVASVYFEVAAVLDCLIMISNRLLICRKRACFITITIIIITFFFIFYIPWSLRIQIFIKNSNTTSTSSIIYSHKTINRGYFNYFKIIHTFIRDIVPIVLIVIINILIFLFIKSATKRRELLEKTGNQSNLLMSSLKAQRNKFKMILVTALIYILHVPFIISYTFDVSQCFTYVSKLLFLTSYAIPIFSYFFFNKKFRRYFMETFLFHKYRN
jgi:hypothetical protein